MSELGTSSEIMMRRVFIAASALLVVLVYFVRQRF